ncbi:MAG: tripartite tricarboxylate transporter permease [Proteobacteria bacterium]|nr:tripartite tricarboxylate transporter permease [Pseudomonadota bacterium]
MFVENVIAAFAAVFALKNFVLLSIGVLAGIVAGAIPGFTITMAVVLVLPFTFGLSPVEGLSTMLGVFVGGFSGGLISAQLMGIPGTPSAVATTFDGFPMVRRGKPGLALGLGVWSSFFGGLLSAAVLITTAPALARVGLEYGPWDYFMLIVFALTITASLAGENMVKGLIAGVVGLLAAAIGEEEINGVARLTFGIESLGQGFAYLPVLIGLFAFSQLLSDVQDHEAARRPMLDKAAAAVRIEHWAAIREIFARWPNLLRSSAIGVFVGILPAAGGSISNILAYDQAKKASRRPEEFGTGIADGIIAPESANNATAGGALTIMMALGIPGDAVTAVMLGALLIHNVVPSPSFIRDQPVLAYSIFVAFFFAHFVMIAMQAVGLRLFLLCTRLSMYVLAAVILFYCAIGIFALNNVTFDIWTMFWFGLIGYVMRVLGFPLVPMILGVVLGNIAEINLNRAVSISVDPTLFLVRPWSLFFLILAAFSAAFPWFQAARGRARWTLGFIPALSISTALPLFMMGGWVRPLVGAVLVGFGLSLLWRRAREGWRLEAPPEHRPTLSEG